MKWVTEKPVKLAEKHSNKAGVFAYHVCAIVSRHNTLRVK